MLTQQTVTHLRTLRLDGMARAFEEQLTQPLATGLAFEDRFGLLVDRELAWRDTRRLERLLKQAKLKYPDACIENLDTRSARGLDPRQLASLAGADWIRSGHSILITGATGLGKTWLAAFDSRPFARVLFIAHRRELLRQAENAFRAARPGDSVGYVLGDQLEFERDMVFASVQTLSRDAVSRRQPRPVRAVRR